MSIPSAYILYSDHDAFTGLTNSVFYKITSTSNMADEASGLYLQVLICIWCDLIATILTEFGRKGACVLWPETEPAWFCVTSNFPNLSTNFLLKHKKNQTTWVMFFMILDQFDLHPRSLMNMGQFQPLKSKQTLVLKNAREGLRIHHKRGT